MKASRPTDDQIIAKTAEFMRWQRQFEPQLMKLYQYGFKCYLIKKDGTIETILHEAYQKQIDAIHDYIEHKRKEYLDFNITE